MAQVLARTTKGRRRPITEEFNHKDTTATEIGQIKLFLRVLCVFVVKFDRNWNRQNSLRVVT